MSEFGVLTIVSPIYTMRHYHGVGYRSVTRRVVVYQNDSCTYDEAKELAAKFREMHREQVILCDWQPHARAIIIN